MICRSHLLDICSIKWMTSEYYMVLRAFTKWKKLKTQRKLPQLYVHCQSIIQYQYKNKQTWTPSSTLSPSSHRGSALQRCLLLALLHFSSLPPFLSPAVLSTPPRLASLPHCAPAIPKAELLRWQHAVIPLAARLLVKPVGESQTKYWNKLIFELKHLDKF